MLLSKYFLHTLKEQPAEAQVISHSLMLRSGMIKQQASGIYSWLPLGHRVLKNIENIVRVNMNAFGAIELLMPCVQPSSLWIESGRFNDYGKEMLKFHDRHDNALLFGPTNEEMITDIFRSSVKSYKDLPKNLYHIQWKFRDEIRPRFGVMRGREFLMKDAYSFDIDKPSAIKSYDLIYNVYVSCFHDMGVSVIPVAADNGVIGGDLSHEFHVLADTGESTLYYDKAFNRLINELSGNTKDFKALYAVADDKYDKTTCRLKESDLCISKGIEVGHIFYFGTKYSKMMNAFVNDSCSNLVPVEMGAYGIGISRLVAAIIEANHDDKGIIWPIAVAPFKISILNLNIHDGKCTESSHNIYNRLKALNIDVLYDDTDESIGSKFAVHDLIGSPLQIIIGPKNIKTNEVEIKHRASKKIEKVDVDVVIKYVSDSLNVR